MKKTIRTITEEELRQAMHNVNARGGNSPLTNALVDELFGTDEEEISRMTADLIQRADEILRWYRGHKR